MLRSRVSQFSKASNKKWQQLATTATVLPSSSSSKAVAHRNFSSNAGFFDRMVARFKADQLRESAMTSDRAAVEYLSAVSVARPEEAKAFIERGWESGRLPFNDAYLRQYLSAVGNMGKLQSLNIAALLQMYQKHLGVDAAAASASLTAALRTASAEAAAGTTGAISLGPVAGPGFTAAAGAGSARTVDVRGFSALTAGMGGSPNNPIFVTMSGSNWREQVGKVVTYGVCALLTYVLFSSFFDEKMGGIGGGGGGGSGGSGGGGGLNPFNRVGSGSAVHQVEKSDKTFADVVGVDEAKHDLQEIVLYLKDPRRFTRLGGKLPKGVLLTGPPGTGKTLLARAIAGEAGVPFFHASGSEFEEMFVGVGAKRVRELFDVAKQKAPCIIFIDEIDAIGGSRHLKDQSAMKMTLNQLLVEMDGFQQNNGVIVIAATNFPDSLDSALVRPGRFDKHVEVAMPDIGGRKAILEFYSKKIPLDSDVDLDQLSRATPGFSGAELFNLMNTAALRASVENLNSVNMAALEHAKDKIMMGAERKSAIISPETLAMTAYHEAGHALVALKTDGADPIHKATIMPRGRALGMVMQLPDGDQTSMSRKQMLARLDVCMGGRVAEELVYGAMQVTSGAMGDIQQATRLARAMVMKYGLSESLGMRFIDEAEQKFLSPTLQQDVDKEVKALLEASYSRARAILEKNRKELENIAQGLLDYESLSGSEIVDLMQGKKIVGHGVNKAKRSQRPSRPTKELTPIAAAIGANGATAPATTPAAPPSSSSSSSSSAGASHAAPEASKPPAPSPSTGSSSARGPPGKAAPSA